MFGNEILLTGSDCSLEGMHVAEVISNADPKAQERVFCRVFGVHDMTIDDPNYGIWIDHLRFSKYQSGEIPDIKDHLWVTFPDKTDPMKALWHGWVTYSV
jgi:hypothetical protein